MRDEETDSTKHQFSFLCDLETEICKIFVNFMLLKNVDPKCRESPGETEAEHLKPDTVKESAF